MHEKNLVTLSLYKTRVARTQNTDDIEKTEVIAYMFQPGLLEHGSIRGCEAGPTQLTLLFPTGCCT
jgi:hypothetical protein